VIKKILFGLAALVIFAGASVTFLVIQQLSELRSPVAMEEPVAFEVERGMPFIRVAREMEDRGWVDNAEWLRLHGRFNPEITALRAGHYEFTPGMSAMDMLEMMVAGDTKHWPVRFLEGWTFQQMREELARHERLEQTLDSMSDAEVMEAMGMDADMHPEGWFFPDTYNYHAGQTDLSVLRQAFNIMNRTLAEEWANRAEGLPYDTPYEALIMASIIERETSVPWERPDVAGVFVRRLEKGMRLQTDPTVIYGMGDRYDGRIRRSDLQEHTPWNTYRISGLPPTPIAMPGRGAIHAAVNPADGDTYYFVAKGDGTHTFSRTLAEHQRAVREFQLQRREDYRSFPASPPVAPEKEEPVPETDEDADDYTDTEDNETDE